MRRPLLARRIRVPGWSSATARLIRWLAPIRASIPVIIAICSNGGLVVDLESGAVSRSHLLDGSRLVDLVERLCGLGVELVRGVEGLPEIGMLAEEHYPAPDPAEPRRRALPELVTQPVVKGIIRTDARVLPSIRALVESDYGEVFTAT
jgi:hypothetical protein